MTRKTLHLKRGKIGRVEVPHLFPSGLFFLPSGGSSSQARTELKTSHNLVQEITLCPELLLREQRGRSIHKASLFRGLVYAQVSLHD